MKLLKIRPFWSLAALIFLFSSPVMANLTTHYCAHSASYIHLGNSPAQVATACGNPSRTQIQATQPMPQNKQTELWSYTADQLIPLGNPPFTHVINTSEPVSDTPLKVQITDGFVTRIIYHNVSLGNVSICRNKATIATGETAQSVQAKCGNPSQRSLITHTNHPNTASPPQIMHWYYADQYAGNLTLTFSNNRLTDIAATGT